MNAGAQIANGTILYFLHADSFPPMDFDLHILESVERNRDLAGCFRMKFDHNHWILNILGWLTRFNSPLCRGGDQSLFITKKLFVELQGFNERYIINEDNNFIKKLYARKEFSVLPYTLYSSARLFVRKGVWTALYHHFRIHLMNWQGASPESLYAYYKKNVAS